MKRIVILISGRGSNMAALIEAAGDGRIAGSVAGVISNRGDAAGLALARAANVPARAVEHARFPTKAAFETALCEAIDAWSPDLVVLAGFMRVLTSATVERYAGRLVNIHPSLLPAYPGLDTHRKALADGVRIHGCTVHFVTADVDRGPIIAQAAVPVRDDDTEATLATRVLGVEHRLLVGAVGWFCSNRLVVAGAAVRVKGADAEVDAMSVPRID
jgi:phosphoribosylglycinamide formyltransferase-1